MSDAPDFVPFFKIARLSREIIVTEKIDGTNGQVFITEAGDMFAGSRSRWITPQMDNHGFAKWVEANRTDLLRLGPGAHFGEWWGQGIQRGYGLTEKRWSLFNVRRWGPGGKDEALKPTCCHVVPILERGIFDMFDAEATLETLRRTGSHAAPGFMKPEGIVIFHVAAGVAFKKTLERDEEPKSRAAAASASSGRGPETK